ncbi:MAG: TlpA family protein disulfide reductase [Alphaproteobacteria bacterium]|nr:MAG: TlpA family protein disulfide reductase [Alphaproteobacteria bacterium]
MTVRRAKFLATLMLLTFTGLGAATSTAFSQNLSPYLTGEMEKFAPNDSPKAFPDITFVDADGKARSISDFKGKVVLLNFWATWCAPCRKEMPSLNKLQGEMGSDDFEVVAISQDLQGMGKVQDFFKKYKLENLAAYNDKTVKSGRTAGVFGLPASLILNADGKEVGRLVGPAEWDSKEARALIEKVMSGS